MKTIKVFKFDELSPEAQKVAIEASRYSIADSLNECDASEYMAALKEIEAAFCISVYDWEVGDRGVTFRFEFTNMWGDIADEPNCLMRWLNNQAFPACAERKVYYGKRCWDSTKKRTSRILYQPFSYVLTGTWCTQGIDDALNEAYEAVRKGWTIRDFVEDALHRFFSFWREDREHNYDDEVIADDLMINDYEFLESGCQFA